MNDGLIHHSLRFLLSYKLCGVYLEYRRKTGRSHDTAFAWKTARKTKI